MANYDRKFALQVAARIEEEIVGQFETNNGPILDILASSRLEASEALFRMAMVETRDPAVKRYQDVFRRHLGLIEFLRRTVSEGKEAWRTLGGETQNALQDELYPPGE